MRTLLALLFLVAQSSSAPVSTSAGPQYVVASGRPANQSRENQQWTFDTLREDLLQQISGVEKRTDQRFDASEKAVNAALAAAEKAVNAALVAADRAVAKAEGAAEKRFDSTNEFRSQQKDLINVLLPRQEAEVRFKTLEDRVTRAEASQITEMAQANGRASITGPAWAVAGAVLTALIIAGILAFSKSASDRIRRINNNEQPKR